MMGQRVITSDCDCEQDGDFAAFSDVNKDLGLKAKAKDWDPKAKAKDLSHKAKDLGPKAKAKDSRYQGQIFHRSPPYIIFSSLTLCECFYVRVLHFVSL